MIQMEQQPQPQREMLKIPQRVEFLSQMSVNKELDKLNLNMDEQLQSSSASASTSTSSLTSSSSLAGARIQPSISTVNVSSSNATGLISALDDSLTSIEPNLLDEDWVNSFLIGTMNNTSQQQQQQQQTNEQISPSSTETSPEQQQQQQATVEGIDNDAMLSSLNSNNSVILNDAPIISTFDRTNSTTTATNMLFVNATSTNSTRIEFDLNNGNFSKT